MDGRGVVLAAIPMLLLALSSCGGRSAPGDRAAPGAPVFDLVAELPYATVLPGRSGHLAHRASDALATVDAGPSPLPERDAREHALRIPFGARVDYFLELPEDATVAFERAVAFGDTTGHLELTIERAGAGERRLEIPQTSVPSAQRLPSGEQSIARLSIEAVDESGSVPTGSGILLVRPTVRGGSAGPRELGGESLRWSPGDEPAGKRRPNIVLYLIDTLRADRLGAYGQSRALTPRIDEFSQDAALFERVTAQASYTRPAVASLLTGVDAISHRVLDTTDRLSDEARTLAEILGEAGYHCAGFTTNPNASLDFGFQQGFHEFRDFVVEVTGDPERVNTSMRLYGARKDRYDTPFTSWVNEHLYSWLDQSPAEPFFLFVHTVEPHLPYEPSAPFRDRFAADIRERQFGPELARSLAPLETYLQTSTSAEQRLEIGSHLWMEALSQGLLPTDEWMRRDLLSLYDAQVAEADRAFGALLDELRRRGLYENSIVVLVSDHGEEFEEHGHWEHGKTLYEEVLHVPMIVKLPLGRRLAGVRVAERSKQIDLLPTILDFLTIPIPEEVEGGSLLASLTRARPTGPERAIFSALGLEGRRGVSVTKGEWKLIRMWSPASSTVLHHLGNDPAELVDVAPDHPLVVAHLSMLVERRLAQPSPLPAPTSAEPSEPIKQQLRALGYAW